jgi:hypothetical protein
VPRHWLFDSISESPWLDAPGAEDNASGTAAVLECARILASSDYDFQSTVRFVLFSGEEEGDWGSYWYVEDNITEDIQGVFNLDMVGYMGSDNVQFGYHCDYSLWLAELATNIVNHYVPQVPCEIFQIAAGELYSDQYPFDKEGLSAILVTEDDDAEYPYYHTSDDTIDKLNFLMLERCTKIALAATAQEAGAMYKHDWISPVGYEDPEGAWYDETLAYDGDLDSKADTPVDWLTWQWTPFIVLTFGNAPSCDAVRFVAWQSDSYCSDIDIDAYYGGGWHGVYQGSDYGNPYWTWTAKPIPSGPHDIEKVRVRFLAKGKLLPPFVEADLNELMLREVKRPDPLVP